MSTYSLSLRLSFRVEGAQWSVYIAPLGTMDGAKLLASVAMSAAEEPEIKELFMRFARDAFDCLVKTRLRTKVPGWNDPVRAPEHERSGSA